MQHRYAGDIGDFSKFILLERLIANDLRLGVLWYLNTAEETNRDGTLIKYSELRKYNPSLFDKLSSVANGRRCITALEASGVVPLNTLFFRDPVPANQRADAAAERGPRNQWIRGAADTMREADILFLDPDNGIAPPGVSRGGQKSMKYAFCEEITYLLSRGSSLVVYQHHERKPLESCISARIKTLREFTTTWALSFHRRSVRTYFVMAQQRHEHLLWNRSVEFITSPIGIDGCFRLHPPGKKVCSSEHELNLSERTA